MALAEQMIAGLAANHAIFPNPPHRPYAPGLGLRWKQNRCNLRRQELVAAQAAAEAATADKAEALETLAKEYKWKPYPQKHFESRFTKFYEGYWLPERFGFDTRKVQYSSLILTGQMTRDEALEKLKKPAYDPETIDDEFSYIATKLGITVEQLREYFTMPKKFYWDYKNQQNLFTLGAKVLKAIGAERSIKR